MNQVPPVRDFVTIMNGFKPFLKPGRYLYPFGSPLILYDRPSWTDLKILKNSKKINVSLGVAY